MQDRARENTKISWELNKTPLEVMAGENGSYRVKSEK